jgi:hypothetical protein
MIASACARSILRPSLNHSRILMQMNMGLALPQWVIFVMTTLTFKFGLADGSAGVLLRRQARRSYDPSSRPPQLMQISRALPAACE